MRKKKGTSVGGVESLSGAQGSRNNGWESGGGRREETGHGICLTKHCRTWKGPGRWLWNWSKLKNKRCLPRGGKTNSEAVLAVSCRLSPQGWGALPPCPLTPLAPAFSTQCHLPEVHGLKAWVSSRQQVDRNWHLAAPWSGVRTPPLPQIGFPTVNYNCSKCSRTRGWRLITALYPMAPWTLSTAWHAGC